MGHAFPDDIGQRATAACAVESMLTLASNEADVAALAYGLASLYQHCIDELVAADAGMDVRRCDVVRATVNRLHAAWQASGDQ